METNSQNQTDCFDLTSGLVPIEEAERRVLENIRPLTSTEIIDLPEALSRVLAKPAKSKINVPPHANSAMDGFAIAGKHLPSSGSKDFCIVGEALAGTPWNQRLDNNETVRVTTGAVMPSGADTVIIQEDVEVTGNVAVIRAGHRCGQNVRSAGEDLKQHDVAVAEGTLIGPAELGVLASIGIGRVEVVRKPVVAIFSTGDELKNAGEPLNKGAIYDSNRYVLMGLLKRAGLSVMNLGIIPDNEQSTLNALADASAKADAVITSGGVSTGSADYVIKALQQLGQVNLWRIAIRPGRPFAFGRIGQAPFFGLPGNPVAVMVTYYRLVLPALRKLMGMRNLHPVATLKAKAASSFRKKPNRAEVYRAVLTYDHDGTPVVSSTGQQGSGLLHSMSEANCLVLLDEDAGAVKPGDLVNIQMFDGLN